MMVYLATQDSFGCHLIYLLYYEASFFVGGNVVWFTITEHDSQ